MRGEDFVDRNGVYTLKNDCYIIDGLQRVTAAIKMLQKPDGKEPRLGAVVHFGTTEEWERERFRILNADRTKLSPNVLLRNFRQSVPAIDLLYHLSGEQEFALKGRISWGQRMNRDHLTTALSVCKVISILHSGIMVGLRGHRLDEIVIGLQTVMSKIGRDKFRRNVITFFDVIDEAWGIRSVAFKEGTPHIRNTFLFTVATLLAKNSMFWEKDELTVPQEDRKRFRSFPLNDPNVRNLSGAGGRATHILYQLFVEHMNHGRRSRKLSETVFGHAYPIADGA
ncbi:TPA: hypothetical protein DCZ32_00900 [Candidatus Uhrbacteria bacterium]|nr:hypothetical protein [Candidatus Uhrbacteria bacterium]